MEAAALGLRRIVPALDVIASSPLVRARQTAEIVAAAYETVPIESVSALSGEGKLDAIVQWVASRRTKETVALVGHEPDLSALISYLLANTTSVAISMKKGAVCLLEFDADVKPGMAVLRWFLAPKQLRAIGGARA